SEPDACLNATATVSGGGGGTDGSSSCRPNNDDHSDSSDPGSSLAATDDSNSGGDGDEDFRCLQYVPGNLLDEWIYRENPLGQILSALPNTGHVLFPYFKTQVWVNGQHGGAIMVPPEDPDDGFLLPETDFSAAGNQDAPTCAWSDTE
ncbi:hypothetical protein DFQ27_002161, partial [Actinomortierella ambigua]